MKKEDLGKIVIEGIVGIALSVVLEGVVSRIKNRKKQENPDSTMVGDLTVGDLREILREEA